MYTLKMEVQLGICAELIMKSIFSQNLFIKKMKTFSSESLLLQADKKKKNDFIKCKKGKLM